MGSLPSDLHEGPAEVCREWAAAHMPGVDSRSVLHSYRCMYTMTPDLTFVVGAHPDDPTRIAVGCGFSGEGYKFAPVVGEALAHIALGLPEPVPGMNLRFSYPFFFVAASGSHAKCTSSTVDSMLPMDQFYCVRWTLSRYLIWGHLNLRL